MVSKIIQVRSKDSAFVYAIFESLEGMLSYSTLDRVLAAGTPGGHYCTLSLWIPKGYALDFEVILEGLRKKIPILENPTM